MASSLKRRENPNPAEGSGAAAEGRVPGVFSKPSGICGFFYTADEIWDGQTSLVFRTDGKPLAELTLDDGVFSYAHRGG